MNFEKTEFEGVFVISKTPFVDERGSFSRTYCVDEFQKNNLLSTMVQTNLSISNDKYTLRGMHLQIGEDSEDKLIQCIKGSILDVIIDLRKGSKTFKKHFSIELNDQNNKMLFVPKGFAHGFMTLEEDTRVLYQVSSFYTPNSEIGIRWNDLMFKIKWPSSKPVISDKDSKWKDFESFA